LYLIGLGASLIGDNAMSLVAGIWVKSLTGSSTAAGLVSVCIYAPSLTAPICGLIADRVRRRRYLIGLNVLSAALTLPLLAVHSTATIWIIFAVMAWYGLEITLAGPAENALFAEMLPGALRQRVNGWRLGLQETGRLVAPLIGAAMFAVVGGRVVALFDVATFIVAAALTAAIRTRDQVPDSAPRHWRTDIVAGVGHIRAVPELRRLVLAAMVVIPLSGLLVAPQYSLVQAMREPPAFLGVLTACLGAGSIIASLVSGRLVTRVGEFRVAVLGMADFAVGNLLRATGGLPAVVAGFLVLGFALPWVFLAVLNISQRLTPLQLQGRVSAAVLLALFGPQAPAQALGSLLIKYLAYWQLYLIVAGMTVATTAWLVGTTGSALGRDLTPEAPQAPQ
jgi:MFS family permease